MSNSEIGLLPILGLLSGADQLSCRQGTAGRQSVSVLCMDRAVTDIFELDVNDYPSSVKNCALEPLHQIGVVQGPQIEVGVQAVRGGVTRPDDERAGSRTEDLSEDVQEQLRWEGADSVQEFTELLVYGPPAPHRRVLSCDLKEMLVSITSMNETLGASYPFCTDQYIC